jgi:Na+-translocating ferredoxin:NAD+ oxidoreductase RnfG subunit
MAWRRRWSTSWSLLGPVAVLSAPAPVFAVDYLSAEQAERTLFEQADSFQVRDFKLDPQERQAIALHTGATPRERWQLRVALHAGAIVGVVVVDDVIGKFERITYATGIDEGGRIKGIEILSYRESHGHEVRLPAWRGQFVGKDVGSPLRVGQDISNISGATLSCHHVTEGVRRVVAVVDTIRRAGALK